VNKLERQIVLADTQVFSAVSLFLQQELTGYVRGCWMLRKAWRVYQHAYTQISQLYRRTFGISPSGTSLYQYVICKIKKLEKPTNYNRGWNSVIITIVLLVIN